MASASDILLAALFFLLIAIDVTGNTLICLVVYRTKQMRKPMNYLLVNLAVADIVIGVFMLPRHVFHQSFEHPTGKLAKLASNRDLKILVQGQERVRDLTACFKRKYLKIS